MKISTRGRYALRVMIDLVEHTNGEYTPLMDVAKRQEISEKYLESIVAALTKSGLLISLRGKGGGYKLARKPEEYSVGEILHVTEGMLAPLPCVLNDGADCPRAAGCKTISMWKGLYDVIENYLAGVTLASLARDGGEILDYVI